MLLDRDNSLIILVDVQEKLTPNILHSEEIVARCEWLLQLASVLSIPCIVSEQYPKGLGTTVSKLSHWKTADNQVEKVRFSCANEPALMSYLEKHQKKQVILIGIETHVCILQSAIEFLAAGKEVFVVVDAVSSRSELDGKYGLKRMKQLGVQLVTSEMVFFEWVRLAGSDEFKRLSRDFLQ